METHINGQPVSLAQVDPELSALEFLRERRRLTGAKLVCGEGVCGACAIRVDGVAVNSCLLPATALADHAVETIEAYADPLHPVQKAIMACDGLQCGFCTPGFVIEGISFYERWRAAHGVSAPSRAELAEALAGHLCRCGAYAGILEAISGACAGRFDAGEVIPPRVEAVEKVTGRARYTVDIMYEGQLEGRILRSPHPHARVHAIDAAAALALEGVRAVVDLLGPERVVRYVGQEIAAVAAVDHRTAQAALGLIRVEYEPLPAVIGMAAARAAGAPPVYGARHQAAPSASEFMVLPGAWRGNVRGPLLGGYFSWRPGAARRRIAAARAGGSPHLVEGVWRTGPQAHTSFEPHAAVARWEGERLTVHLSTQSCDHAAREIAHLFRLPRAEVRVRCEHVGGAFGAKQRLTTEAVAAIKLSKAAGAPVRVALDRQEELTVGGYRPGTEIHLALLADADGAARALSAHVSAELGVAINSIIASMMSLIYNIKPRALIDDDVVSNVAPAQPFRGPGGPQACWALEQAVDQMAHQLGTDPITLRRRWDDHPLRRQLYRWAESLPVWRERGPVGAGTGRFRRGVGLAAAHWPAYFLPAARVEVASSPAGLVVRTATQDMGNGTRGLLARVVAGVFGLPPTAISVHLGDSQAPRGPHSAGSMTTSSLAGPARRAALRLRAQLLAAAGARLRRPNPRAARGGIAFADGFCAWDEVLRALPPLTASAGRGLDRGIPAVPMAFGMDGATSGRVNPGAVVVVEVEVDTRLGRVRPLAVWEGLAAGRIIVPALARSQCYGGIIQGLSYALYEQRHIDPASGRPLSIGVEDCRLAGIGDVPEMTLFFLEEGFAHVPGGATGLSEIATVPVAAALANAVFHATGRRPYQAPILPAHIIEEAGA
jgi:xanthine dehydrogenase YagR molybdenum-binding subunit